MHALMWLLTIITYSTVSQVWLIIIIINVYVDQTMSLYPVHSSTIAMYYKFNCV